MSDFLAVLFIWFLGFAMGYAVHSTVDHYTAHSTSTQANPHE